jgi:hypothetical protein
MENEAPRRRGRPRKTQEEANLAIPGEQKVEKPVERPAMRTEMRERDPRAEAERRAAEIFGHVGSLDEGTDDFYVNPAKIPDGWVYEWKRRTVYGQEDPAYQVQLARTGWTAVPASRHPEMMPATGGYQTIERKGQVLMERPKIVTDHVIDINRRAARDQVRVKEKQLSSAPDGQFGRDHAQVQPKINKGYEPMPIPGDK